MEIPSTQYVLSSLQTKEKKLQNIAFSVHSRLTLAPAYYRHVKPQPLDTWGLWTLFELTVKCHSTWVQLLHQGQSGAAFPEGLGVSVTPISPALPFPGTMFPILQLFVLSLGSQSLSGDCRTIAVAERMKWEKRKHLGKTVTHWE